MHTIFAVLVATCSLVAVRSVKIDSTTLQSLSKCRDQEDSEQCVIDIIESLQPCLSSEEYYIQRFVFLFKDQFVGKAHLRDIVIYGLKNFTITNVQVPVGTHEIKLDIYFPYIRLHAFYIITGEIYGISIKTTKQYMNEDFLDVIASITINDLYHENNEKILKNILAEKDLCRKKREDSPKYFIDTLFSKHTADTLHKAQTTISDILGKIANKTSATLTIKIDMF